ncbi:ArnT family glycosyltransferase [Hoeflea sp. TYP-13]|uniref:ArnT family glycosyltransferase n=1 Tax=Hoeflea sp. TYP-13 TaxID=3230023 RepID=UPI0034C6C8BC
MSGTELNASARDWFAAGAVFAALLTLFRVAALWFDKTDLFVDESQYWLWGQDLDFGYYSKPPLIAWIIRLFTEIAQSDAVFWVRLPAPLFHFATALILGGLARYLHNARTAFWVMLSYITMPAVSLGSAVISTDTMMAPFFSLALLFYVRMLDSKRASDALLAGLMAGIAFMAKYAGIYFLLCAFLAAVLMPTARPTWRNALIVVLAFCAMALPNIVWNFYNDLSTFEHTLDNADWVRKSSSAINLKYLKLTEFFFSQFGVFGPILFGTMLACIFKSRSRNARLLLLFSIPVIFIVCIQALLSRAYANWAVAAYFGGTVLVVAALLEEHYYRLLKLSVWIGAVVAVGLPILTIVAYDVSIDGEKPALKRLLGRERMSLEIIDAAKKNGADVVLSESRDWVADLHYTGRDEDLKIRTHKPRGRPRNYYQLKFPFDKEEVERAVLLVSHDRTVECKGEVLMPVASMTTSGGAYHGGTINAFVLKRECFENAD